MGLPFVYVSQVYLDFLEKAYENVEDKKQTASELVKEAV